MNPIARWLRTTFDFNPAFPLSALALLIGLRLLADEGGAQAPLAEALLASGILQAYEVLLLGVALLVLWPRKVAYETTAILIILGVVRFAAPFMAARLAGEGELAAALTLGFMTWALSTAKVEVAARRLGLDWTWRERLWDAVLFGVACVALPLLAERLATLTGLDWSHSTSRGIQLVVWWALAAALAPLALGAETLGEPGSLRSRRPALVWRALTFVGIALLACNALWIGGGLPRPLALVPLIFVGIAVACHVTRAWGGEVWPKFAHLPAVFLGVGILGGDQLSRGLPLSEHHALVLLAIACALAIPLLVRERHDRRQGARSLAIVAAAAPLPALPGTGVLAYGFLASLLLFAWSLYRRRDLHVAAAALSCGVLLYLLDAQALGVSLWGACAALALAGRASEGELAPRAAYVLSLVPGPLACLGGPPSLAALACFSVAAGSGALLAHRRRDALWFRAACLSLAIPTGRKVTVGASTAHVLLGAAFGAIPLGTWLALRREARAREADAELMADPRFEEPPEIPTRPLQEAA